MAAMLFGGVLGPLPLKFGVTHPNGATASPLLNLEAILILGLARLVIKKNVGRPIVLRMLTCH